MLDMSKNTFFLRTNSDQNPSAQTNTLLQPVSGLIAPRSGLSEDLERNKGMLGAYYYLFCLMQSSGCRIAEILSSSYENVTSQGKLLIRGKKGSKDRLISDARVTEFLISMKELKLPPFFGCNRFTARRMLQRVSIFTHKKGRKNLTMTGIFRESYASEIREIEDNDSKVSELIGHRNPTNGKFYGKG